MYVLKTITLSGSLYVCNINDFRVPCVPVLSADILSAIKYKTRYDAERDAFRLSQTCEIVKL